MTRRIGGLLIIEPELPQQCDDCGEVAELRPYGPPGEDGLPTAICHVCAEKDPEGTTRRFYEAMGWET